FDRRICLFIGTAPTELYTFPYTTLFRSTERGEAAVGVAEGRLVEPASQRREHLSDVDLIGRPRERVASGLPAGRPDEPAGRPEADRKSTRLNSSHVESSYAVFCLKKKKH